MASNECPKCGYDGSISIDESLGGAAKGAAAGAAVGSLIPVIGTAIGASVGGFLGLVGGASKYTCKKCGHKWED